MCQQIDFSTTPLPPKEKILCYRLDKKSGTYRQCSVQDVLDAYGVKGDGIGKTAIANDQAEVNADAGAA